MIYLNTNTILYFIVIAYISLWLTSGIHVIIINAHLDNIEKNQNLKKAYAALIVSSINLREKLKKELDGGEQHPVNQNLLVQIIKLSNEVNKIEKKDKEIIISLDKYIDAANNFLKIVSFGQLRIVHKIYVSPMEKNYFVWGTDNEDEF